MQIVTGFLGMLLLVGTAWAGDYTIHDNGTVTDNASSLIWQREDDNTTRIWQAALSYCEGLSLGGYNDWRLPNCKELESITDDSRYNPAIDTTAFPNTNSSNYWSSTTNAHDTDGAWYAWYVSFDDGYVGYDVKGYSMYARCVRGGQ